VFGVLVIVVGIVWSAIRYLRRLTAEPAYDIYKIRIGRSLLLGFEVLVAADIVKTIAFELKFSESRALGRLGARAHVPELVAGARDRRPMALAAQARPHGRSLKLSRRIAPGYRLKSDLAFPLRRSPTDPPCGCGLKTRPSRQQRRENHV